jgi:hypothetical protein
MALIFPMEVSGQNRVTAVTAMANSAMSGLLQLREKCGQTDEKKKATPQIAANKACDLAATITKIRNSNPLCAYEPQRIIVNKTAPTSVLGGKG